MIVVYGLGCNADPAYLKRRRDHLLEKANASVGGVTVMCNPSTLNALADIGKQATFRSLRNTGFVNRVTEEVRAALGKNKKVILIGHSYGGSVVARVVRALYRDTIPKASLDAITMGSIHIPRGINAMRHLMYTIDIAILCNRCAPWMRRLDGVDWLKPRKRAGPVAAHMDYHDLVNKIVSSPEGWITGLA